MKFKNVLQPPTQGSEDGMYYVKKGDKFEPVMVSEGVPYGQNKVIAEYVHSGNLEVRVESADFETNTFYSPNHGLVDGDKIYVRAIFTPSFGTSTITDIYNTVPIINPTANNATTAQVLSKDTFKVMAGGVELQINPIANFEAYIFERTEINSFVFENLGNLQFAELSVIGPCFTDHHSWYLLVNEFGFIRGLRIIDGERLWTNSLDSALGQGIGSNTQALDMNIIYKVWTKDRPFWSRERNYIGFDRSSNLVSNYENLKYQSLGAISSINAMGLSRLGLFNTCRITLTGY